MYRIGHAFQDSKKDTKLILQARNIHVIECKSHVTFGHSYKFHRPDQFVFLHVHGLSTKRNLFRISLVRKDSLSRKEH
jgi:hypothetical protein